MQPRGGGEAASKHRLDRKRHIIELYLNLEFFLLKGQLYLFFGLQGLVRNE